jgi:hypothetical protein
VLESAYETCLLYELEKRNLPVRRQAVIPFRYEALIIDNGYRIDLLVADLVVVELKALEAILRDLCGSFAPFALKSFRPVLRAGVGEMREAAE